MKKLILILCVIISFMEIGCTQKNGTVIAITYYRMFSDTPYKIRYLMKTTNGLLYDLWDHSSITKYDLGSNMNFYVPIGTEGRTTLLTIDELKKIYKEMK